jgi:hypothetical protein
MNPTEYSRQHTQLRARERYGFEMSEADYDLLTALVKTDLLQRVFPEDDTGPLYKLVNTENGQHTLIVPFDGRELVVVFDTGKSLVTTLLPPEQFFVTCPTCKGDPPPCRASLSGCSMCQGWGKVLKEVT